MLNIAHNWRWVLFCCSIQLSFVITFHLSKVDVPKSAQKQMQHPNFKHLKRSTHLYSDPFDSDLPSFFGINPLEALIIFGGLYVFVGPDELYKYTREAGRLFSTYSPIVKQTVQDVYYEFRDYMEEDRERETLKQAGVDLESLPRRTTNILERFQENLKVIDEMQKEASSNSEATNVLRSAYSGVAEDGKKGRKKGQLKKKDLLLLNDKVEIAEVLAATVKLQMGRQVIDQEVVQSIQRIQETVDGLQQQLAAGTSPSSSSSSTQPMPMTMPTTAVPLPSFSDDEEDGYITAPVLRRDDRLLAEEEATVPPPPPPVSSSSSSSSSNSVSSNSLTMSKFQQQMSGEWNQRVLRQERHSDPPPAVPAASISSGEMAIDNDKLWPPSWPDTIEQEEEDLMEEEARLLFSSPASSTITAVDIPPWLDAAADEEEAASSSSSISSSSRGDSMSFLKELDRDYLALRNRVLSFLQTQQEEQQEERGGSKKQLQQQREETTKTAPAASSEVEQLITAKQGMMTDRSILASLACLQVVDGQEDI